MRRPVFRGCNLLLIVTMLLWISATAVVGLSSAAQEATTPAPAQEAAQAPETEPQPLETIRLSDVPSRAEVALALAAETETLLEPIANVVAAEERLPEAIAVFDVAYAEFEALDLEIASVRRIRDLSQVWSRYQASLISAQSTLVPRREELQANLSSLRDSLGLWERTRDSLADTELPEGVGERITSVLEILGTASANLEERLAALLTLETRVSEQLQRVNEVLRQLQDAEATARQRLLIRDTTPLWSFARQSTDESLIEQATDTYIGSTEALRQFLTGEVDHFILHVVLFLILLLSLAILKRWTLRWKVDNEALERAKFVLSRPVATATLLSLFATQFIYEAVPDTVRELSIILTLVPILRLVPGIFRSAVRSGLYGFLCLFFFGHVLTLIPEGTLLNRLVLLVISTAGVATLVWFLRRPPWPDTHDLTPGWRAARRCLQIGTILLGISAVGNVLGWLRLANLLVGGTIYSAYGAVLAYALWAVLTGILAALPFTPLATRLRSLDEHGALITRRASAAIALFAVFLWLRAVAVFFDVYEPLYGVAALILEASVAVGALSISLGKVLTVVLILWLAHLVSRVSRFLLQAEVFPRIGLQVGEAQAAATLTHYVIGAIAIVGAAAALGVTGTQIAMLIGALGVGIGFGLQNIVNNFISGLILIFERPIKVGDMVEVGQLLGTVQRIGIRASIIRTFDGADVVVPNGDLISKEVTNWTLSDQVRRRELSLGVAYGTPPEEVIKILAGVVKEHPVVLDSPEPMILFQGFVEGTMRFSLRYWMPIAGSLQTASEVAVAANAALRAAGIRIPVPQREIVVRRQDGGPGEEAQTDLPDVE